MDISNRFTADCVTSSWSGSSSSRWPTRGRRRPGIAGSTTQSGRTVRWCTRRRRSSVRHVTRKELRKRQFLIKLNMRGNVVPYFHFKWTKKRGAAHRCNELSGATRPAIRTSYLVIKRHHAALVGLHFSQMQGDVSVKPV